MEVTFFKSAAEFRAWLELNHATATELLVGFYKKTSGKSGLSYREAVEEALCFGWIDGIVRKLDEHRYSHRFTPRRRGSIWSLVNVDHVNRLTAAGKMHAAGIAAFNAREEKKTGIYSFEKAPATLPPELAKRFRANNAAWAFFSAQAPWYQRLALHKVTSPKREETRQRWFDRLVTESAAGRRIS